MSSKSSPPVTLGGGGKEGKERKGGGMEGKEEGETEDVSIHKQTAVTRMDKMSQCVCVQNILTGQRRGNESLPLKCCHGVSLQQRGWAVRQITKDGSRAIEIKSCSFVWLLNLLMN